MSRKKISMLKNTVNFSIVYLLQYKVYINFFLNWRLSECETSVCETKTNDSSSDIQAKASETNQQNSCEKSKDQKVFECDICTYKTKSENGIKIHKGKKHTVTELLQTKLTIEIISQDVTAHTVAMILPWAQYIELPPYFPPWLPHEPHPIFPSKYPPRLSRSPMYWVTVTENSTQS